MAFYTYRCPRCDRRETVSRPIVAGSEHVVVLCVDCPKGDIAAYGRDDIPVHSDVVMKRDYRTDSPQPAPMWPEHLNPTTNTVVRSRAQLQSDMDRQAAETFERTGIESRPVVVDRADLDSLRPATVDS